jgi:hypothetical protein
MKIVLEIVVSAILHPLAVILMWINLIRRNDMGRMKKILWAVFGLIWGIGPILYVLLADGRLW